MIWVPNLVIGDKPMWPTAVRVVSGRTDEKRLYVTEKTAKRVSIPRESHVALGHYECGACGTIVGAQDRYCRMCRAELEDE